MQIFINTYKYLASRAESGFFGPSRAGPFGLLSGRAGYFRAGLGLFASRAFCGPTPSSGWVWIDRAERASGGSQIRGPNDEA
jgi:hypothetical protein